MDDQLSPEDASMAVIGTGTWGSAVAWHVAQLMPVWLWGRDEGKVVALASTRRHDHLSDVVMPANMLVTADTSVLAGVKTLLWAVPTQHTRAMARMLADVIAADAIVVSLAKGLEHDSQLRVSEILRQELPQRQVAVLSGPSHAEEVVAGQPVALTLAGTTQLTEVISSLHHGAWRVYTSDDLIGVELAGALKNVIAIAAGVVDGLSLGDNAKAALITRGLAEMRRLGRALGAQDATFAGLAGVGDLLTTCYSPHGRNRALGVAIGQGTAASRHLASSGMVAEGAFSVRAAVALGQRCGIELPIASQVASMVWHDTPAAVAMQALLTRSQKDEEA